MPMETKKAIADAFMLLMQKKSIDKITVKDITESCGIARQSFYYHFQDTLDLVEWIVEQKVYQTVELSLEKQNPVDAIECFVQMAVEGYSMMKKLTNSQRHEQFQKMLIRSIETYLIKIIEHKHPDIPLSRSEAAAASRFYAFGIAGLLLEYSGNSKLNSHRLAEQICRFMSVPID